MRQDLAKVICERERRGGREKNPQKSFYSQFHPDPRKCEDEEDWLDSHPRRESKTIRLGWFKREFSDRLGAIKGLLWKNVGRPWDKVYSEICSQFSPAGPRVYQHVHQHLSDFISIKVSYSESGELMEQTSIGLRKIGYFARQRQHLYVCPNTKLIKVFKPKKVRRKPGPNWRDYVHIQGDTRYAKLQGIWYSLSFTPKPNNSPGKVGKLTSPVMVDGVTRHYGVYLDDEVVEELTNKLKGVIARIPVDDHQVFRGSWSPSSYRVYLFGRERYVRSKKQLNSNELKKLGLTNG